MPDSIEKAPAATCRRISIGFGIYEEQERTSAAKAWRATGKYYHRIRIPKKHDGEAPTNKLVKTTTWRLIPKATNRTEAKEQSGAIKNQGDTFAAAADLYERRGCPTLEHEWQPGSAEFISIQTRNARRLVQFFGRMRLNEIHCGLFDDYFEWRTHGIAKDKWPTRQIDTETQTACNIKGYALRCAGSREPNNLKHERPRYHKTRSRSRERMPESAEVIHALAEEFFKTPYSEVFAWLMFFEMFTGCRKSELTRLRIKAGPREAGFITRYPVAESVPAYREIYRSYGKIDLGRRAKQRDEHGDGVKPECDLWPEFADMLDCFLRWHEERWPDSPWFFPGRFGGTQLDRMSFNHALNRVQTRLGVEQRITPHGFRSYFTTKLIRDGFRYEDVAEMIGDKTTSLLRAGYSRRASDPQLSWTPKEGLPAWRRWAAAAQKIVPLNLQAVQK